MPRRPWWGLTGRPSAAAFTKRYMLFFVTTALIYLVITLISNYFIGLLENRYRRGQTKLA